MIKPKPCPFCGGKVAVVICDDEGNLHDDDYLFNPYSGVGYKLRHTHELNPECPIAEYEEDEGTVGVHIYDYSPYVVGKEGLLKAIEIYKRKIIDSYEDLLKDGAEYALPFGCNVKVDDIKSVDKLADFVQDKLTWWKGLGVIDLDESHEWLSKSWQYEHQIFDLVRLYKSIDWNKYTLIFLGR